MPIRAVDANRARARNRLRLVAGAVPYPVRILDRVHVDAPGQRADIPVGEHTGGVARCVGDRPIRPHPGLHRAGAGAEVKVRHHPQRDPPFAVEQQPLATTDARTACCRALQGAIVRPEAVVGVRLVERVIRDKAYLIGHRILVVAKVGQCCRAPEKGCHA